MTLLSELAKDDDDFFSTVFIKPKINKFVKKSSNQKWTKEKEKKNLQPNIERNKKGKIVDSLKLFRKWILAFKWISN